MCVRTYIRMRTHVRTHIRTCVRTCIRTNVRTNAHVRIVRTHIRTCVRTRYLRIEPGRVELIQNAPYHFYKKSINYWQKTLLDDSPGVEEGGI